MGANVGSACATCEAALENDDPSTYCDLHAVYYRCKHSLDGSRKDVGNHGEIEAQGEQNYIRFNHGSNNTDDLHVIADSRARGAKAYSDRITCIAKLSERVHPGHHPYFDIIDPQGKTTVLGQGGGSGASGEVLKVETDVKYPTDWWSRRIRAANAAGGFKALVEFFYPGAVVYRMNVATCGRRRGNGGFGSFANRIHVYPDDVFKFALALPSAMKRGGLTGGGTVDDATYRESERNMASQFGGAKSSQKMTVFDVQNRTVLQEVTSVQNRKGGIKQTQTLSEGGTMRDQVGELDETDRGLVRSLEGVTFSRNGNDLSSEVKFVQIIKTIIKVRAAILEVINMIRQMANMVPKVGWSIEWTFDCFAGSFALEWGWKERPESNLVYRWYKLGARLNLIDASVKASFGLSVEALSVVGRIYLTVSGKMGIYGDVEGDPAGGASLTVGLGGELGIELGVEAQLTGYIKINGNVSTGVALDTKLKFNPKFDWTFGADLLPGVAKLSGGIAGFTKTITYTFWKKRALIAERSIL